MGTPKNHGVTGYGEACVLDPRYRLLHKKVKLKDGRSGIVRQVLRRIFVQLDEPIILKQGKSERKLGVWVDEVEE